MALVDLVKVTVLSTGTGPLTLGAAVPLFRGVEALTDGETYSYSIQQDGAGFEVGKGVYSVSAGTLTRGVRRSSNGNAAISLRQSAVVSFTALSEDFAAPSTGGGGGGAAALEEALAENTGAAMIGTTGGADLQVVLNRKFDATANAGSASDIDLGQVAVPAIGKTGEPPRLFSPFLFASRRTRDLAPIATLLGDEIIPSFSPSKFTAYGNGDFGATLGALAGLIQGFANPKLAPFNAKGDGKVTQDAAMAAGSNVLTSADGQFSVLDVGKQIWVTGVGATGNALASTIATYVNPTQVILSNNASFSKTGQRALWGTDDTAALQAWLDSIAAQGLYNFGKVGLLPEGIFLSKQLKYHARMAIKGAGRSASAIALIPGGTGNALLENFDAYVDFPEISDLTLIGNQYINTSGGVQGLRFVSVSGGTPLPQVDAYPQFQNITIDGFPGSGFYHGNRGGGVARGLEIKNGNYYGLQSNGYDMTYTEIVCAANRLTGIYFGRFGAAGNSIRNWYSFFNGSNPYSQGSGGVRDLDTAGNIAWEDAANIFLGGATQVSAGRAQESWGPNLVVGPGSSFVTDVRLDDTGDVNPVKGTGRTPLMSARPAICFAGGAAQKTTINNALITTAVHPGDNYATHAIFFAGNSSAGYPSKSRVEAKLEIDMPYAGWYGSGSGYYTPAVTGTNNPAGYGSNHVTIDGTALF